MNILKLRENLKERISKNHKHMNIFLIILTINKHKQNKISILVKKYKIIPLIVIKL